MRLLKWGSIFAAAFALAWVLIFTFSQAPFREKVPTKLLAYQTPDFPIYYYVAAAFGIGLLFGLIVALYYFISLQTTVGKKAKRIRELEQEVSYSKIELKTLRGKLSDSTSEKKSSDPSSPTAGGAS